MKHEDELCYMPQKKHVKGAWEDFISFNHQERDVGERGKQGLLIKSPEEAREACEPLCLFMCDGCP